MWIASESSLSLIMQSVVIPAATEWLSTWAAKDTFMELNAGNVMGLSVKRKKDNPVVVPT